MKNIKSLLFLFALAICCCNAYAQKNINNNIIYNLPKSVEERIGVMFSNKKVLSKDYVAIFSIKSAGIYNVSLLKIDFLKFSTDSLYSFTDKFIKYNNRFLEIKNLGRFPILFSEDFLFGTYGEVSFPNGKRGKRKILVSNDGYNISFDARGNIFD